MASKSHKGITRIEYEGVATRGWMVRITRNGERKQQFFNDKAYGNKTKALKAAQACYAEWEASAPPIATTKNVKTARNSSGRVGVHLIRNVDTRWQNAESFGYCASWISEDGKRCKVSFAFKKYGKKNAWLLACLAREHESADRDYLVTLLDKQSKPAKKSKAKK